jgi:hypothetical protein
MVPGVVVPTGSGFFGGVVSVVVPGIDDEAGESAAFAMAGATSKRPQAIAATQVGRLKFLPMFTLSEISTVDPIASRTLSCVDCFAYPWRAVNTASNISG